MENGASVQLVEEHGWTIVNTSEDSDLEVTEKASESVDGHGSASTANTKQGYEEDLGQIKSEQTDALQDCKMELEQGEMLEKGEVADQGEEKVQENAQKEELQAENDELEEGEEGFEVQKEKRGAGEEDKNGGEGEEDEDCEEGEQEQDNLQRACADGERACADDSRKDGKQMLVQKHQTCFLWRVSLMVVLGFFGWAVLTVDGDGAAGMNLSGTPFLLVVS